MAPEGILPISVDLGRITKAHCSHHIYCLSMTMMNEASHALTMMEMVNHSAFK